VHELLQLHDHARLARAHNVGGREAVSSLPSLQPGVTWESFSQRIDDVIEIFEGR
jgi:hypothetical protein